ncbi:hypothetical protein HanOQP8_Chr04g0166211 [Helianthus annuus]|nr:hypothetical protein HanOQP8_Chr04g0166211 [Helianthus annuus]
MPVGLKQKQNVNTIVQKCFQFLQENFTVILFHYDGKLDGWWDLKWSKKAVHIVANNQTKWWFAKRFLHPASVSLYDYVFLWDEDLGVQHFNPKRYNLSICCIIYLSFSDHMYSSKMTFSSLRFGQFCDFRLKVCFSSLDPKGLKSCHFHLAC